MRSAYFFAVCAAVWGCSGGVPSQFGGAAEDGSSGDDGGQASESGGPEASGGTCQARSCKACVLGQVSCTPAGGCQCCVGRTCLPD